MTARQELMKSNLFGDDIGENFSNHYPRKVRFCFHGYGLRITSNDGKITVRSDDDDGSEAWEKDTMMDPKKKAFYEYNSCIMEPWDGVSLCPFYRW